MFFNSHSDFDEQNVFYSTFYFQLLLLLLLPLLLVLSFYITGIFSKVTPGP